MFLKKEIKMLLILRFFLVAMTSLIIGCNPFEAANFPQTPGGIEDPEEMPPGDFLIFSGSEETNVVDYGVVNQNKVVSFYVENNTDSAFTSATPQVSENGFELLSYSACPNLRAKKRCLITLLWPASKLSNEVISTELTFGNVLVYLRAEKRVEDNEDYDFELESYNFGDLDVGQTAMVNLKVINSGNTSPVFTPSLSNNQDFYISTDNCGQSPLLPNQHCLVRVVAFSNISGPKSTILSYGNKSITIEANTLAEEVLSQDQVSFSVNNSEVFFHTIPNTPRYQQVKIFVKNTGAELIRDVAVSLSSNAVLARNTCSSTLQPTKTCQVWMNVDTQLLLNGSPQAFLLYKNFTFDVLFQEQGSPIVDEPPPPAPTISYVLETISSNCSLSACQGQAPLTESYICSRREDGVHTQYVDLSFCPQPSPGTCLSPAGTAVIILANGVQNKTCAQGQTTGTTTTQCNQGYVNNEGNCVPDYKYELKLQSSSCSMTTPCQGTANLDKTYLCSRTHQGSHVNYVNLSLCPQPTPETCSSPAGTIPMSTENGTATKTCGEGSTTGTISLSCDPGYKELLGICTPDYSYELELQSNNCPMTIPCQGQAPREKTYLCSRRQMGNHVGYVDLSLCPAPTTEMCSSPQGELTTTIDNGSSTKSCAQGQSEGIITISCSPGYKELSGACVADYTFVAELQNSFCPVSSPCQGQAQLEQTYLCSRRQLNNHVDYVDNSFCQIPSPTNCSSPEGSVSSTVENGIEVKTCDQGSTTGPVVLECSDTYINENGSCVPNYSYELELQSSSCPVSLPCQGQGIVEKNYLCSRKHSGNHIDYVDLNNCPIPTQEFCYSPAGEISNPSENGSTITSCGIGQTTGSTTLNCNPGYNQENNSCVLAPQQTFVNSQCSADFMEESPSAFKELFPSINPDKVVELEVVSIQGIYGAGTMFSVLMDNGSIEVLGGNASIQNQIANQDFKNKIIEVVSNETAFVALMEDKTLRAWGDERNGGRPSDVATIKDVKKVYATSNAFAALKEDGSVVAWGNADGGGNLSFELRDVKDIYSNDGAFAAIKNDESVVVWGASWRGGNQLDVNGFNFGPSNKIKTIKSLTSSFAALMEDGTIRQWGNGGTKHPVALAQRNIVRLYSNKYMFAALDNKGKVFVWMGNTSQSTVDSFGFDNNQNKIKEIFSNHYSFAALMEDGTVRVWGDNENGGNQSEVSHLKNIKFIYSNKYSFAAIDKNNKLFVWGNDYYGGTQSEVENLGPVLSVISNDHKFLAITEKNSVVGVGELWGNIRQTNIDNQINTNSSSFILTDRQCVVKECDKSDISKDLKSCQ